MKPVVFTKNYSAPDVDRREILRYAKVGGADGLTEELLESCLSEICPKVDYRVCFAEFPINKCENGINLGFAKTASHSLCKNLENCSSVIVFCATVGIEIDRLIARYSKIQPSRSVMLQAIGTERVEALCDAFCAELSAEREDCKLHSRFSPGYGDLPLDMQREIFRALECGKRIGVTLGENLFMTPTKSVTAIIGVEKVK